jgi:hypothetical protein
LRSILSGSLGFWFRPRTVSQYSNKSVSGTGGTHRTISCFCSQLVSRLRAQSDGKRHRNSGSSVQFCGLCSRSEFRLRHRNLSLLSFKQESIGLHSIPFYSCQINSLEAIPTLRTVACQGPSNDTCPPILRCSFDTLKVYPLTDGYNPTLTSSFWY